MDKYFIFFKFAFPSGEFTVFTLNNSTISVCFLIERIISFVKNYFLCKELLSLSEFFKSGFPCFRKVPCRLPPYSAFRQHRYSHPSKHPQRKP